MFAKILIANRGEIACRIIRTARRLGIRTVAVYSTADSDAQHVAQADEAFCIGPPSASESYLDAQKIIDIALQCGAEAIHPGYGFLSENTDFAKRCAENDLVFIGPPVSAIQAMGSKSQAKEIMDKAGVPFVPGYHGEDQTLENLQSAAHRIGYPVLLKASAGGGGKGMRIVESEGEFPEALQACRREARASFSNDEMLVEKYLTQPRHVEIQIFADNHGNVVHLFERDCSVQRRHQKIIEEAPAPDIPESIRASMAEVAVRAAKAIGYAGAGTVEFLYDRDGSFYFMEMNTRLQVEHPVTEMITGLDLVEWQFLVAVNEVLPLQQQDIGCHGHAFEVRVYAEDPDQNFLPATGSIIHMNVPPESAHVRIDTGFREGDEVSVFYDPLIAKLIVWDTHRNSALARLRGALNDFQVLGVTTNLKFLGMLAANSNFNNLDIDTSFIQRNKADLFPPQPAVADEFMALAGLYKVLKRSEITGRQSKSHADPHSPWHLVSAWRNNQASMNAFEFWDDHRQSLEESGPSEPIRVTVYFAGASFDVLVNGKRFTARGSLHETQLSVDLSGQKFDVQVIEYDQHLYLLRHGESVVLGCMDTNRQALEIELSDKLLAPMPGTLISVRVDQGQRVKKNQTVMVLEAMKMEHSICAPFDGIVTDLPFQEGDMVQEGAELIIIDPDKA